MCIRDRLMCNVELDGVGETPAAKITRLQKVQGGAFNGVWRACARKHPAGPKGNPKGNPALNSETSCRKFLDAWKRCGFNAYEMDRRLGLRVDWDLERSKWMATLGLG
eukprot:9322007-Pyramimonas_sp.AAC.1